MNCNAQRHHAMTSHDASTQNAMNETHAPRDLTSRVRELIPGYKAVLVTEDVKTALHAFREQRGFGRESHIERCLATAGLRLLLDDPLLHDRWLALLGEAVATDFQLVSSRKPR